MSRLIYFAEYAMAGLIVLAGIYGLISFLAGLAGAAQ